MQWIFRTICVVGAMVAGSYVIAEEQAPAKPTAVRPADNLPTNADEQLASVILAGSRNEVEIAKFAKPMLKSSKAKEFADRMVKEHQAANDKLEKFAGKYAHADAPARRDAVAAPNTARPVTPRSGNLDWPRIHDQVADKCLASAKKALEENDGDKADACFMGQQLAAHMAMIDKLKVFQDYASPELRVQFENALKMTEDHLKQAESIMKSLDEGKSEKDNDNSDK